ncbi:hypothetical protein LINGRAHAP2_LOCUS2365 [Linum grandiflorum]
MLRLLSTLMGQFYNPRDVQLVEGYYGPQHGFVRRRLLPILVLAPSPMQSCALHCMGFVLLGT